MPRCNTIHIPSSKMPVQAMSESSLTDISNHSPHPRKTSRCQCTCITFPLLTKPVHVPYQHALSSACVILSAALSSTGTGSAMQVQQRQLSLRHALGQTPCVCMQAHTTVTAAKSGIFLMDLPGRDLPLLTTAEEKHASMHALTRQNITGNTAGKRETVNQNKHA